MKKNVIFDGCNGSNSLCKDLDELKRMNKIVLADIIYKILYDLMDGVK